MTVKGVDSNEVTQPAGRRLGAPSLGRHGRFSVERISIGGQLNDKIGEVAGRVWRQLRAHGPATTPQLAKAIGRSDMEISMAMGWLAREGKVRQDSGERVALVEHEMRVTI
jgi:hypothetical protein